MTEVLFEYFSIQGNADQTEGLGSWVDREMFLDREIAEQGVQDPAVMREYGIQGVQGLQLVRVWFELEPDTELVVRKSETLWGYRKGPDGRWREGWMDGRELKDPRWQELKKLADELGVKLP